VFFGEDILRLEEVLGEIVESLKASGAQLIRRPGHLLASVGRVDQGRVVKQHIKYRIFLVVAEPRRKGLRRHKAALVQLLDEAAKRDPEPRVMTLREFGPSRGGPGRRA